MSTKRHRASAAYLPRIGVRRRFEFWINCEAKSNGGPAGKAQYAADPGMSKPLIGKYFRDARYSPRTSSTMSRSWSTSPTTSAPF